MAKTQISIELKYTKKLYIDSCGDSPHFRYSANSDDCNDFVDLKVCVQLELEYNDDR